MAPQSKLVIQFPQGERSVVSDAHEASRPLTELLRQAELPLNTRCGQRGLCDGCFVELLEGALRRIGDDQLVSRDETSLLRACQHALPDGSAAVIRVPARSLLAHKPQVVTSFCVNVSRAHDPLWQRIIVPGSQLAEDMPVAAALCRAVTEDREADLPVRADSWEGHTSASDAIAIRGALEHQGDHWELLPLHNQHPAYGVAIDIGTTTVVALLVDLATGDIVSSSSALNAQTRLGDNVLTRINLCLSNNRHVGRLRHAIVRKTLRPLVDQLLAEAQLTIDRVVSFVVAGNTTMLHLLVGVDPSSMGTAPFTPEFIEHRVLRAGELSLTGTEGRGAADLQENEASEPAAPERPAHSAAGPAVHLLPGAAAYVGADVIAGVLATGMAYQTESCLLVDMGTNGEIVLKHGDRIFGCATAAGPAFEGAGLTCGVRAGEGAISHVRLVGQSEMPEIEVIGGGKPIGLCGTAYVDFVAQARMTGLITSIGRYSEDQLGHPLLEERDHGRAFTVAYASGEEPLVITEADIASLLQAKAAIAAGIACLLGRVGLESRDIMTLYLAGGFGFHMDVENVIRCGVLPGFRPDQIQLVGNTALAGAYLALMDSSVLAEIKRIASDLETVELNLDPSFQSRYIDQLSVPG